MCIVPYLQFVRTLSVKCHEKCHNMPDREIHVSISASMWSQLVVECYYFFFLNITLKKKKFFGIIAEIS